MPKDLPIHADASVERLWTGATVITFIRTLASLALCLYGAYEDDLFWLVIGLAV
jgi:CDP-diacylglycerol---glycerol-3-phosphate 3-phosphatidyltransferase